MPVATWVHYLLVYKYFIAFPLAIVEGPVVMVLSGFLWRLGTFSFWPIYFALMLGDFVSDLGWYAVGYFGARKFVDRFGHYFSLTPEVMLRLENIFKRHQDKILFISKITMGFGFALATLITAGLVKVNFKRYALYNFLGGFIWTAFLLLLGYFFGNLYNVIDKSFRWAFVIFLLAFIVAAVYGASRYFKGRFLKSDL